jgi:hypothetical protein
LPREHGGRPTVFSRSFRHRAPAASSVSRNVRRKLPFIAVAGDHHCERQADTLWQRVERVRHGSDGFTRQQGFLSAGERASYDRALDAVATRLCRR